MKENLFEMLLSLFEKSLAQIKKKSNTSDIAPDSEDELSDEFDVEQNLLCIKTPSDSSFRVLTELEQLKLSQSSSELLIRLRTWGIIDSYLFELILNQLELSDSHVVSIDEAEWVIRDVLSENLSDEQLAFLDIVLYQKEDHLILH